MKPCIAYLTSEYPAPSHTFIEREVKAMREHGLDIATFSIRPPTVSGLNAQEQANTFYVLPFSVKRYASAHAWGLCTNPAGYFRSLRAAMQHRVPGLRAFAYAFVYFAEAIVLAHALRARHVRHLHNHFANPSAIVGYLAAKQFLGITWSLTLHGHSETDYPAGNLLADKIAAADFVGCISNFGCAQAFRVSHPKHWGKIFLYRCGLDLADIPPNPTRDRHARFRFISVARLAPEKGHSGVLQAFAAARHTRQSTELVLVGDGPERKRLEQEALELGIDEDVTFLGALSSADTLTEMSKADALILGSFMEGLPVVIMEAMAMGKTVIVPNIAGIPDIVNDGGNGLLYRPADWQHLASQMRYIQIAPAMVEQFRFIGPRTVHEHFTIQKAIQPLLAQFRALR